MYFEYTLLHRKTLEVLASLTSHCQLTLLPIDMYLTSLALQIRAIDFLFENTGKIISTLEYGVQSQKQKNAYTNI
jgi:hypothetical protein